MSIITAKSADVLQIAERASAASAFSAWYVVHTHVHSEAKAAAHLARQGYLAYLPRYLKKRRHARRTDTVAAPLFPRYLFVAFNPQACRWRSIQSTVGVAHLVCNGDEPATVPSKSSRSSRAARTRKGSSVSAARGSRPAPGSRWSTACSARASGCTKEWRTPTVSGSCSICSAARCASCWTARQLRPREGTAAACRRLLRSCPRLAHQITRAVRCRAAKATPPRYACSAALMRTQRGALALKLRPQNPAIPPQRAASHRPMIKI